MVRIYYNKPLYFPTSVCKRCRKADSRWVIMHYTDDGIWRVIPPGSVLSKYGIDESVANKRFFLVHYCSVEYIKKMPSISDVYTFFESL